MHELAREPQAGAGVQEMRPADPAIPDRAGAQPLVKPRQRVFGRRERTRDGAPGQRIGQRVNHSETVAEFGATERNRCIASVTGMVNQALL